jgi:hypothetical protein
MSVRSQSVEGDNIAVLLSKIGQLLAEDIDYPLEGTLLHARVDRRMVGPSIFKDMGDHLVYRDPDLRRLGDCVLDLWEAFEPRKRWAQMEYVIRDGRFDVKFIYPHEVPKNEYWNDTREEMLKRHFGNKPVVYPPLSDDDDNYTL